MKIPTRSMHALRRLLIIKQIITPRTNMYPTRTSSIRLSASPVLALVDEKLLINVRNLCVATVTENGRKFESRGVYQANNTGDVDLTKDVCLAGTFTGMDGMGLFWSLRQCAGQKPGARFVKIDVCTPIDIYIPVYDGHHGDEKPLTQTPFTVTKVQRLYKRPGVRRIPLQHDKLRGTMFVPEGKGPFPGLLDVNGTMMSLLENRAALLASRGYATFALCYLYGPGLPQKILEANVDYFKKAIEWFSQQDFVDDTRLAAVGHSYGGFFCLLLAEQCAKIRAVVNVAGLSLTPPGGFKTYGYKDENNQLCWPDPSKAYVTEEGVVLGDCFDNSSLECIPAWKHNAEVLNISGLDDFLTNPTYLQYANK